MINILHLLHNRHYTIVAPQNIRANSEYHVSASLHDATEPSTIRVTVKNDRGYKDIQEITVQPYTTKMVQFSVSRFQLFTKNFPVLKTISTHACRLVTYNQAITQSLPKV